MILFIAPNPHKLTQREGFLQRVMAIDLLFPNDKKLFYEDLKTPKQQVEALAEASLIYVHSIYHANKILRLYPYFANKIITDLHGVVPEEEIVADNHEMHAVMADTEAYVFAHGKYFVAVTDAMVAHFKKKYAAAAQATWVVLPISHGIQDLRKRSSSVESRPENIVVYAGGSQPWQNVDKMVEAINKAGRRHQYLMLTHNPEAFVGIQDALEDVVTIKSVPSAEIAAYYAKSTYGFVLRDDHVVNRVACPTKLIEYLAYGVIPVVLSESIGDFKAMGYRYVALRDFLLKPLKPDQIAAAVKQNHRVFEAYCSRIEQGEKALRQLQKRIAARQKPATKKIDATLLERELEMQVQRNDILRYEYQVSVYKQKLTEYADSIGHYQAQERKLSSDLNELRDKRLTKRVRRTVARVVHKTNRKPKD